MIKNSFLIILGLFLIHSNSSEAFLWGLSEKEKVICRKRASREQNDFSAKKSYEYCKKNIKAEIRKEEKYKFCMNENKLYISNAKYEKDKKVRKLIVEEKNNPPEKCPEKKTFSFTGKSTCEINKYKTDKDIISEEAKFDEIVSRVTSQCKKKAGYR